MTENTVTIRSESIQLDQFLKWVGWAESGGQAKVLVGEGRVKVNGSVETRRTRQLFPGDRVKVAGVPECIIRTED